MAWCICKEGDSSEGRLESKASPPTPGTHAPTPLLSVAVRDTDAPAHMDPFKDSEHSLLRDESVFVDSLEYRSSGQGCILCILFFVGNGVSSMALMTI